MVVILTVAHMVVTYHIVQHVQNTQHITAQIIVKYYMNYQILYHTVLMNVH